MDKSKTKTKLKKGDENIVIDGEEYTPERIRGIAEKRFYSILKSIQYIHNNFFNFYEGVYRRSLAGKHLRDRLETQLMTLYGISKVKGYYLQDETKKDEETGNLLSVGPDKFQLEVMEAVGEDGEIDDKKQEKVIKKIIKLINSILHEQQEEFRRKSTESPDNEGGGFGEKGAIGGDGDDTGGHGDTSLSDSGDTEEVLRGRGKCDGGVPETGKATAK